MGNLKTSKAILILLIQIAIVFVLNFVLMFLAAIAFVTLLFKGDMILAGILIFFVLLGVIPQPWLLLYLLVPATVSSHGTLFAPFVATAITVPVYRWLNYTGRLTFIKRWIKRFGAARLFMFAGFVVVSGIFVGYARYRDFPALNTKIPSQIKHVVNADKIKIEQSYQYQLSSFLDSEYLWKGQLSKAQFETLVSTFGLEPQTRDQIPSKFQSMQPYWWQPDIRSNTQIVATPNFPSRGRGQDGLHLFATWNSGDRLSSLLHFDIGQSPIKHRLAKCRLYP